MGVCVPLGYPEGRENEEMGIIINVCGGCIESTLDVLQPKKVSYPALETQNPEFKYC